MANNEKKKISVFHLKKKSVNRAIEILQPRLENRKRSLADKDDEKYRKIMTHCTSIPSQKKLHCTSTTGFSKSLFTSEVRSHLRKHNWALVQSLYPLLPDFSNEIEYLMWRYALTILLYSPNSDSSNLKAFLELCIGNQGTNNQKGLERLFLLQNKK